MTTADDLSLVSIDESEYQSKTLRELAALQLVILTIRIVTCYVGLQVFILNFAFQLYFVVHCLEGDHIVTADFADPVHNFKKTIIMPVFTFLLEYYSHEHYREKDFSKVICTRIQQQLYLPVWSNPIRFQLATLASYFPVVPFQDKHVLFQLKHLYIFAFSLCI